MCTITEDTLVEAHNCQYIFFSLIFPPVKSMFSKQKQHEEKNEKGKQKQKELLGGQLEFCHWYVQAVPRAHPQLVLLGHRVLAVGLQGLPTVPVVVHARFPLLAHTHAAAVFSLHRHLGDTVFGAEASDVRGPQGAGGGGGAAAGVEVDVGGGGEAWARPKLRLLRTPFDADDGGGLFVCHAQFVQFLEVFAESAGGPPLQVVGVGHPASSHDGAVLREVDAAVDVAVGQSAALDLATAAATATATLLP